MPFSFPLRCTETYFKVFCNSVASTKTFHKDVSFGKFLQKIPVVRWLAALQITPPPIATELHQVENSEEKNLKIFY